MRAQLEALLDLSRTIPREDLPSLIAVLAEINAIAFARLVAPSENHHQPDKLLTIDEAATRLAMSKDYLYRHKFPFTVREGGSLRFSSHGIDKWIQRKAAK
jgi:predicted DNA-binding transcriptional regulator AlpA